MEPVGLQVPEGGIFPIKGDCLIKTQLISSIGGKPHTQTPHLLSLAPVVLFNSPDPNMAQSRGTSGASLMLKYMTICILTSIFSQNAEGLLSRVHYTQSSAIRQEGCNLKTYLLK